MRPLGIDRPPVRRTSPRALLAGGTGTVLLTLSGCSSDELPKMGMPARGVTDKAEAVLTLWQGSWIFALLTGAVVWGLILWSCAFHRRRAGDDSLPPQVRYNVPIEVLYTAIPFIICAVYFFFTARDEADIRNLTPEDQVENTIEVVGFQWSWQFNYLDEDATFTGTTGDRPTLYLPQGETVQFRLTSNDVIHSFWVPAFLYKMDVFPQRVNRFEITPQREGTYVGKCAELCGTEHARMLFNVEIVSPEEYQRITAEIRDGNQ